ncbi:SpoIIE family protein phosphatase [Leptospira mayottensis]|uniref:Stage II sporulation protein E n=2 Tax=Leptospira mayottensis TaxID=1137606 RepID=A0AA87MRU0_9LEPT|nr:SpoIIE family protein phosphatase [Leptospira mayottensis]AXR59771.1 serine/threonine protein phosphatase [Leptospira mayottensis]AXR63984.1 serine/threonine protein phosphatase [Leptospira mayottensis]AZQ00908.1 serine/threonine protein phosphatase [Leptospira mayottensis 200901116]EKS00571.1 stage II sporulation protein E [Leptospira mayottensis 200901122]TGN04380.1 serine/threonine protein phosphatase [Leptospira mayottensis]
MQFSKIFFFLIGPFALIILVMISSPWQTGDGLKAYQGKIDLRGIQNPDSGMIKLSGEWEFNWLQEPDDGIENHSKGFIEVPGSWTNEFKNYRTYPKFGYATYGLKVFLPEVWKKKILAISLGAIASAYRIKINGQIIGECGVPGIDADSTISRVEPKEFLFFADQNEIQIEIFTSNYSSTIPGVLLPISIGPSDSAGVSKVGTLFFDIFSFSSLLIMGIYHIFQYLYLRSSISPLYFGMYSLVICLRSSLINSKILMLFFPQIPWPWINKLNHLTLSMGVPFFLLFFSSLFAPYVDRKLINAGVIFSILFSVVTLFGNMQFNNQNILIYHYFILITICYLFYAILKIDFDKERNYAYILYGSGILFIAVLVDLFYVRILKTGSIQTSHYALVFFVFLQSLLLASERSRKFAETRELALNLRTSNLELFEMKEQLVQKIEDRTRVLNDNIVQINRELEIAQNVQRKILTPLDRNISGIRFYYEYMPLEKVGGDFLDISEILPGKVRVLIADAVGHGVQASLMTMALKTEYEELKNLENPAQILKELNSRFLKKFDSLESIFPCMIGDIDTKKEEFTYASAGHPDQIFQPPGEFPSLLQKTGPILGLFESLEIVSKTVLFPTGSRLLLFSDGLIENRMKDSLNTKQHNMELIAKALHEGKKSELNVLIQELIKIEELTRGENPRYDDITIIAVESYSLKRV